MPPKQPKTNKPLWARVLDEKKSRAWLRQHADEFPEASFLPDDVAFKDKASSHQEFFADVLTALLPKLKGDDRKVAKLYLRTHPARIAEELGWQRKDVYLAIRRLKSRAIREWRAKLNDATLERVENLELDAPPSAVAIRTVKFTLYENERHAFLVSRDGEELWVDEAGAVFADDVQEILHDLPQHAADFSVVDVETGS
jgi:hypothetical protein